MTILVGILYYSFMFLVSVVSVMVAVAVGVGGTLLSCNYDPSAVSQHSLVAPPLEVPLPLPRSSDPRPPTPLHQKLFLQPHDPPPPDLSLPGLKPRMVHNDYVMVYQHDPPLGFFQDKHAPDYHLLESLQFVVTVSNPSQVFTICFSEIFSDCESITKALRRPLPLCLKPYTKYPFHFNLYITAMRGRELIKAGLFFNATLLYESHPVLNRIWLREVTFNLVPNHLKLYALELRQCRQEPSIVTLKNPTKQELQLMIEYRHKKYYMNNQPFDEKVVISSGKAFKFLIEGRDATMTIFTHNPQTPQKKYPPLYLPLYCLDLLVLEPVSIGILSGNLALVYPLYLTSHSNQPIDIEQISLQATSQAVQLISLPTPRVSIHPNQKLVQVASMVVRSSRDPSPRNSIMVEVIFQTANNSAGTRLKRTYFYSELSNALILNPNRYFHLPSLLSSYNQTEKIRYFNFSIINKFHIPVRMERIHFNPAQFKMHWYGYTGSYVHPGKLKEELYLQYIGTREIHMSPLRFAGVVELAGGMLVPFEIMAYDDTLVCSHMGREDRCSKLTTIHFGYQKTHSQSQSQTVTIRNLNPTNLTLQLQPYSLPEPQLQLSLSIGKPFPYYPNAIEQLSSLAHIHLRAGHAINLTFQVKVNVSLVGQVLLHLQTKFQKIVPILRFHFQEGELLFNTDQIVLTCSDQVHQGILTLRSTYQHNYTIREVISPSPAFSFNFDETTEHAHLQTVEIPFEFDPHRQLNLTSECCGEEFVRNRFLGPIIRGEEENEEQYQISLVASNQVTAKTQIQVLPGKTVLLEGAGEDRKVDVNVVKARRGGTFCVTVHNPYEGPLKYSVLLLPPSVVERSKQYFSYLKYARRQRVQTYFCLGSKAGGEIGPNWLKEVFRLDEVPKELTLSQPKRELKANANEYLKGQQDLNRNCFKFTALLYFKLLIQSEVLNDLLAEYPLDYSRTLIAKEHAYLAESTFSAVYDEFYALLPLNLSKYCHSSVFPIFRFCQWMPLKAMLPPSVQSRRMKKQKKDYSRVLPRQGKEQMCYLLSGSSLSSELQFHLTIANNYSKADSYSVALSLVQPLIQVGDISFQQDHNINHATFIKHYFSNLHAILTERDIINQLGISQHQKIVPLYLTHEDYDARFGVFKGSRYFQLENQAPVDLQFTHYGFGHLENVRFHQGFSIQQVDGPSSGYLLKGNSKTTFRVDFRVDHSFGFNLTNQYLHHCLTVYLYRGPHYYLQLHLAIKLADNLVAKLQQQAFTKQANHTPIGYILLNLVSFGYICLVIYRLHQEEQNKIDRVKISKEKMEYFKSSKKEGLEVEKEECQEYEEGKVKRLMLPAEAIGVRLAGNNQSQWLLSAQVQEEDLLQLKSLTRLDRSSVISQSSQSEQLAPLNHQEEREESRSSDVKEEDSKQESKEEESPSESIQQEEEWSDRDSEGSLTESMLPDGISVCNEEPDLQTDFEFGFEKPTQVNEKNKGSNQEYKWFESQNPLKKEFEPFPWMTQNVDKKKRPRHRKQE